MKRYEGYDDRIKKGFSKDFLKLLFPYCEHLRNFEFKYDLFRKYSGFSTAMETDPDETPTTNLNPGDRLETELYSTSLNQESSPGIQLKTEDYSDSELFKSDKTTDERLETVYRDKEGMAGGLNIQPTQD